MIFSKIIKLICVLLLSAIVITITASITTRFIFFYPLHFADPLAAYMMTWLSFLGLGIGIRENEHISVDILVNKLSFKAKKKLIVISDIIISLFLIALINYGLIFGLSGANSHDSLVFDLNMMIPYFSVSIGSLYALIELNLFTLIKIVEGD